MSKGLRKFLEARDFLLNVQNYEQAKKSFSWPRITKFNWALDYFDSIAKDNNNLALICADENGQERKVSFDAIRKRSNKVANLLRDIGLQKYDRVLMMMDTSVEIYEVMLGIMKAGGVIIPAALILSPADIADRMERGNVKFVIAHGDYVEKIMQAGKILDGLKGRISIPLHEGESNVPLPWINYEEIEKYKDSYTPDFITYSTDEMLLYFTSGTTAKPKLVVHTHATYPVGHLTTMYWIGVKPKDVHYNISAPGWAKYAWSSLFAPWNAEATIFTYRYKQFDAKKTLKVMEDYKVNTLCAPLSVWKLFLIEDLSKYKFSLREMVSAGEPINPEILRKVKEILGLDLREGYGQTESTCMIANFKGEKIIEGSFGKCAPGYNLKILNDLSDEAKPGEDGQISVDVYPVKPLGLLKRYDDEQKNMEVFKGGWYFTGDSAYTNENGYFYFVGRTDDVFKSLDYRISPFEVESELIACESVLECGVISTVDEKERIVPKAFIVLKPDFQPSKETALNVFKFIRNNIAPYKRPRVIEFLSEFPKTISSKVMRKDLRAYDKSLRDTKKDGKFEYKELDFADELNLRRR